MDASVPAFVALALGSNLGDRMEHLRGAVEALSAHVRVEGVSRVYGSAPAGHPDQPDFLNAVLVGRTSLTPEDLLSFAHRVEEEAGRRRSFRNAPRTLDVDIVLHGDRIREDAPPLLPHPRWRERAFVLAPLADVAPGAVDPRSGRTVESIWRDAMGTLPPVRVVADSPGPWRPRS